MSAAAPAPVRGVFVAEPDGSYVCDRCLPAAGLDVLDLDVEVWEEWSGGWLTEEIDCRVCGRRIPVYADGVQP